MAGKLGCASFSLQGGVGVRHQDGFLAIYLPTYL